MQGVTQVSLGTSLEPDNLSKWDSTIMRNSNGEGAFKFKVQKTIESPTATKKSRANSSDIKKRESDQRISQRAPVTPDKAASR
mmetsp:Transcript_41925/g.64178  ORF Transcript_41925/g.64178 Transcript_41925/m.64178 type:complete len:83 (+) Transcript_41925:2210-2458(+)